MVERGVFSNGVSYVCFGEGKRPLLVFSGGPGDTLPSGFMIQVLGQFKRLSKHYVVYVLARKTALPEGYTTRDMAEDYAAVIKEVLLAGQLMW